MPQTRAAIGFLNAAKQNIPERLYLGPNRKSGSPFASFFLYPTKAGHLDNVSGHLYEYAVDGAKLLHSSGKYNNVYDSQGRLRGSGEGEKALDLFLVMKSSHPFPNHPNRSGDAQDYMRRGSIQLVDDLLRAENNTSGDSFGQFAFEHYYGSGSRWTRQAILTREGYLIVRDVYVGSPQVDSYNAGPCWLLRPDGVWSELPGGSGKQGRGVFNHAPVSHAANKNWFDAPAWDHAWWQNRQKRLLVWIHPIKDQKYGVLRHKTSGDISRVMQTDNSHAFAPVEAGRPRVFLSVLIPYDPETAAADAVISTLETTCDDSGRCSAKIDKLTASVDVDGSWSVTRSLE